MTGPIRITKTSIVITIAAAGIAGGAILAAAMSFFCSSLTGLVRSAASSRRPAAFPLDAAVFFPLPSEESGAAACGFSRRVAITPKPSRLTETPLAGSAPSGHGSPDGTMAADKNAYRDSLAAAECGIDRKKVKEMTTMIGYGCKCSPKRLMTEAEWCCLVEQYDIEETQYDIMASRAHSALFKGISDPKEKMAIALWSEMNRVVSYCGQMRSAGSFVIGANTARLDGRTVLRNAWGTELAVGGGKRLSFGKKLAHIYQGAESKLLWTIWDKFEVGGKRLRDIEGGFGLFIHDGFGIRRDIAERLGDPAKALREFAMREFGWNLAYSCE